MQPEQPSNQRNQALAVGVQKPEVARTPEPFGQHMLEEQPQERRAGNRSCAHLVGLAVLVTKGDLTVPAGDDVLFLNDAAVQITAEIDQRLLAGADGLAVHHPFVGIAGGKLESFLPDGIEHLGTEDLGQRLMIEQIAGFVLAFGALGSPEPLVGIDRRSGHHQMDMRVVIEAA